MTISSMHIDKRSVEEKTDTIWCSVNLENDHYKTSSDYILYFKYYEQGGWLLENAEKERSSTEVIKTPDQSYFEKEIQRYYFDTYEFQEQTYTL